MEIEASALSDLQEQRRVKADQWRDAGIDPYTPSTHRTHTAAAALASFKDIDPRSVASELVALDPITVVGRVVSRRDMGKSVFSHIRDGSGEIQLYLRKQDLGDEVFDRFIRLIDLGDFIEATGVLFRTKTGEITLRVSSYTILTKALNAPPEKWHGLQNVETRYRQRYADLISNADVRAVFATRSKLISAIRRFLDDLGFLEVETPVLQPLYGGAAARPFTTHHNALDQTFYLRIADELYLKRVIVGGFEKVYEISKDFRNEGVDRNHSPEFTMLEWYEAFVDYRTTMERAEQLLAFVATEISGDPSIPYKDTRITLQLPFRRLSLRQAILDASGVDYAVIPDQTDLLAAARKAGADIPNGTVWPRIVDEMLKQFVRPFLIEPTILMDYPVELSPLAKRKPDDPTHAERFQIYIGGAELTNAFTELNDPVDQLDRFMDQSRDRAAGDEEAMPIDMDFVNALMYGMPPTSGIGIGIDRLTALFTNQPTLRDVILFPAMRNASPGAPEHDSDSIGSE